MDFNFAEIESVEFGVGRDDGEEQAFHCVMADESVQKALGEMACSTHKEMLKESPEATKYSISNKYSSREHVYVELNDEISERLKNLHEASNIPIDQDALNDLRIVFCYFARFSDKSGNRLTALRRAMHFKGILKSRLMRWCNDSMRLLDDDVFKLDKSFDLLINSGKVFILHPSGFEFSCKLQDAILKAVEGNIQIIQKDLPIVNFSPIQVYASTRPRAARYLASIKSQQEIVRIDKQHLLDACAATGVEVEEEDDQITVRGGHEMGLLEVLDRRRYEMRLVPNEPEQFRASSRRPIKG